MTLISMMASQMLVTAVASASACCKGLMSLSLGYNKTVSALGEALASALPRCNELQFLCLNGNGIRDSGTMSLLSAARGCCLLLSAGFCCWSCCGSCGLAFCALTAATTISGIPAALTISFTPVRTLLLVVLMDS